MTISRTEINGLAFETTCEACPEQYNVLLGSYQVGYVRLRWGMLTVSCGPMGKVVYSHMFRESPYKVVFDGESERLEFLGRAADAINKWKRSQ